MEDYKKNTQKNNIEQPYKATKHNCLDSCCKHMAKHRFLFLLPEKEQHNQWPYVK